jgi:predicted membrane chloride channel (bestrophin family)
LQEEAAFARFRRALRRSDQVALDDMFAAAKQHTAAAQYASHALPFEVFLLSMMLEEHKQTKRMRDQVDSILMTHKNALLNSTSGFIDPGFGIDDNPEDDLESVDG